MSFCSWRTVAGLRSLCRNSVLVSRRLVQTEIPASGRSSLQTDGSPVDLIDQFPLVRSCRTILAPICLACALVITMLRNGKQILRADQPCLSHIFA